MSSEESDDDFVTFGTALEPLDEAAMPRKKAFTLEDQVARDEKGRRRFHGAFTGGFSAGFMNTVGSMEGWKPAEFKSSRAERGGMREQNPQDFMDDEDMGEFGIAPSRLTARSDYADTGSKRKRPTSAFHDGPIPGTPVLQQLLQNVRETVGVRLLKGMGWKPGQGVGPRVDVVTRRKERRKAYGCEPPPGYAQAEGLASDDDDDDVDLGQMTFAPLDIQPYIVQPKKDTFGLGYSGLDRHSVLGSQNVATNLKYSDKKGKVNIRGQAFGVGAFEEEDEDIYSREDMSQYDFTMGEERAKPQHLQLTAPGVLPGFAQAARKVVKKSYPPPPLPPGFRYQHQARKSRFAPAPTSTAAAATKPIGLGRHDVNAQTRSVMINDISDLPLPPPRVEVVPEPNTLPFQGVAPAAPPLALTLPTGLTPTSSHGATFRPFVHDPGKQKRYEQFLALSDKTMLSSLQPVSLSPWERERERREFEQAALIFKPLAGVMEDRFTRAELPDDLRNPLAVVEKVLHGDETKRNAAKMKMYGTLTREESDWGPCSLLCKRFNVPEPGTSSTAIAPRVKTKYSIFDSLDALVKQEPPDTPTRSLTSRISDVPAGSLGDLEPAVARPPAFGAPQAASSTDLLFVDPATKVDLFKAIFLDSSDDEIETTSEKLPFDEPVNNAVRNSSPPRGLFANIDLDALAVRRSSQPAPLVLPSPTAPMPAVPPAPPPPTPIAPAPDTLSSEMYGPRLPDKLLPSTAILVSSSSSSEDDKWEEKSKKSSHKHKKSKKNKKHKLKKKKNKKRHR